MQIKESLRAGAEPKSYAQISTQQCTGGKDNGFSLQAEAGRSSWGLQLLWQIDFSGLVRSLLPSWAETKAWCTATPGGGTRVGAPEPERVTATPWFSVLPSQSPQQLCLSKHRYSARKETPPERPHQRFLSVESSSWQLSHHHAPLFPGSRPRLPGSLALCGHVTAFLLKEPAHSHPSLSSPTG